MEKENRIALPNKDGFTQSTVLSKHFLKYFSSSKLRAKPPFDGNNSYRFLIYKIPVTFLHHAALEIIETLQCRKRPLGPSGLHRPQSHPGPTPISLHIYPLIPLTYASQDTKGQF